MKQWVRLLIGVIGLLVIAVVFACYNAATGAGVISAIIIAGFTEEQSKSFNDFMVKQSTDMQEKVKGLMETLKDSELIKGIQALLNGDGSKAGIVGNVIEMQKQLDTISTNLAKSNKDFKSGNKKDKSFAEALQEVIDSEEFKAAKIDRFRSKGTFDVKASLSSITGTVNLTVPNLNVIFPPERALAFIPYTNAGVIGNEKNRVLWVEGAYTSNVGYVNEGTGPATADSGTATEKTRQMAKIAAKLPLTTELLEDADYIASAFRMKLQVKSLIYADKEFYNGTGSDGTYPNRIYGIVGQATAFSDATAGLTNTVDKANIGDLIDGCILQAAKAEQYGLNVVWMNPTDFYKFKHTKDSLGEYIFVLDKTTGEYTYNGLKIIQSNAVTADTMTVADTSKIQAWWKRNVQVKFGQMNGTDFTDDNYTAVLFLRTQCVIEGPDQTAVIQVASIAASITAITLL